MAVIEFSRNILGFSDANSTEVNPKTNHPVIHIMPDQKKYLAQHKYGATIRLGAWPCQLKAQTQLREIYGVSKISERHRHRYEVNNDYRKRLQKAGLIISGVSPDNKLIESIELSKLVHPFFIGTQFHPEYQSKPLFPHPIFLEFIKKTLC